MSGIKQALDKFDLGTPMIAGMLGGTADHGEAAKEDERARKQQAKLSGVAAPKGQAIPVRNNMLT